MVALFRVDLPVDVLIGEVAVPIADPSIEQASEYALMHDFEEQGRIVLSVELPSEAPHRPTKALREAPALQEALQEGTPERSPSQCPICESLSEGRFCQDGPDRYLAREAHVAKAPKLLERAPDSTSPNMRFAVGDVFEYFSGSTGKWLQASVKKVEGHQVTLNYADRQCTIDSRAPDLVEYLRPRRQRLIDASEDEAAPQCSLFALPFLTEVGKAWAKEAAPESSLFTFPLLCFSSLSKERRAPSRKYSDWETMTYLLQAA